jgi:hypothetical protein
VLNFNLIKNRFEASRFSRKKSEFENENSTAREADAKEEKRNENEINIFYSFDFVIVHGWQLTM